MKPKFNTKKLSLNKNTVSHLDLDAMAEMKGGAEFTIHLTNCASCSVCGSCPGLYCPPETRFCYTESPKLCPAYPDYEI